jgi:F-type H+-transporting ATPase subunit delta
MSVIGNRYARAFADVVFNRKLDPAQVLREVQGLASTVADNDQLCRVLENPAIAVDQKRRVLDALVARTQSSRPVRNFFAVLIDHERMTLLHTIVRQFELEIDRRLNLTEAEITSARVLGDEEKKVLERQIEKMTGKKVRSRYLQDATLLGGAVVKIGSTVYDGSVLGQLTKLREQLVAS